MRNLGLILTLLLGLDPADADAAAGRPLSGEQIVAQATQVASGEHIEIYGHGVKVDPAFLKVMEDAFARVEAETGLKFDVATLGPKVRVYVSDAVRFSHDWNGSRRRNDPQPIILLHRRAYAGAMNGQDATYIHCLTHLFAWRFHSHTLREGFGDYVARTILPGARIGANPAGSQSPLEVSPDILECLGTTKPPPQWFSTDLARRRAYFLASHRFVKYLIELKGMEMFLKLYASEDPEGTLKTLYGMTRDEAVRAALSGDN